MLATSIALVLSGIGLGIISAIMPLGPVTVLVLRRSMAGEFSGAIKLGLGRVPAESFYCVLATFGIVALLDRFPGARTGIEVLGVLVFLVLGVWLLVQRATPATTSTDPPTAAELRARRWGDWSGFIISMLNPTLLLSWTAVVGIVVSMTDLEPTLFDKIAFPIALGIGIGLGYVILVGFLRRHGARVEPIWVERAIRVMGVAFVGLALWSGAALLGWTR